MFFTSLFYSTLYFSTHCQTEKKWAKNELSPLNYLSNHDALDSNNLIFREFKEVVFKNSIKMICVCKQSLLMLLPLTYRKKTSYTRDKLYILNRKQPALHNSPPLT